MEASEWRLAGIVGLALCVLSIVVLAFPRIVAYPAAALGLWGGLALLLSFPGRLALGKTDVWLTFAAWLIR